MKTRLAAATWAALWTIAAIPLATPALAQDPTDIYLLELDRSAGGIRVTAPPVRVTDRPGYDNQPQFTGDGGILYTSYRDGQADTYRYDIETGRTRQLTRTPESEYSPTPIPGSDRFSVVRVEQDSTQRLWSFAPDGSDPRLLLPDQGPVGYHGWIDDRTVGLFILGEPPSLHVADLQTRTGRHLTDAIGRSIQAVPGRPAVTFTQEVGEDWWIREYSAGLDTIRTVAPLLGPDEYHTWLPDRTLLTAHDTEVLRFDPSARSWAPVVDLGDAALGPVSRLAVSPDGRQLAVVVERLDDDTASAAAVQPVEPGAPGMVAFGSLVVGSLLAMVNPLGALTIFVGLTATYTTRHRRVTAVWGSVTAAAILLVFALFGTEILRFFGITTHAFRIAGGILFFGIGFDMLQAKRSRSKTTPEEEVESAEKHEVAVVPIGIPTLAGPGAITTVIALMGQTETPAEAGIVYVGILVVTLITLVALLTGPAILRLIGQTGVNVFTRLMGLLVMVIGVQFVIDGLGTVVRGWLAA